MADINVTDLTQETVSTMDGSEQVIMFDSAEGKRATVAAVGEYVLKKLTTSLNGSNQTVAAALASLNSDLNNRFKTVASGSIYDLTTTGMYYCQNAVTDKPVNNGGLLIVGAFSATNLARLYISNAANVSLYVSRTSGSTTSEWIQIGA